MDIDHPSALNPNASVATALVGHERWQEAEDLCWNSSYGD
jgi:hypothetical protein